MSTVITILLFAILFHAHVYCILGMTSQNSTEEVDSPLTSNSSAILEGHNVIHGPKTKTRALIESLPGESNRTDLPTARNDSLGNPRIAVLVNKSLHNESFGIIWRNVSQHNESLDFEDDDSTEYYDDGCDTRLRNKYEDDCFENFQREIEKTADIEDEDETGRHICCSSEGYERCCIIGYKRANCAADHQIIKENLKAARMFMATLSDTSCSIHRGKCGFNSAATPSPLYSVILVTLGLLPIAFLL